MLESLVLQDLPTADLAAAWEALVRRDPAASIFHSPRYLRVWHRAFGGRVSPRIRYFHHDGTLVGVVPEGVERVGSIQGPRVVVQFLGGDTVTDYQGPVSAPADRDQVIGAWFEDLARDREWDELVASGLADHGGWHRAIEAAAGERGWSVESNRLEGVCPVISLGGSYEDYLDGLTAKRRHELRRKARKLARESGTVRVMRVPADHVQTALDEFFALAEQREGDKRGFFANDRMREYFGALAREFATDGTMQLHALEAGGRVAAATVSFVDGESWLLYNSAFDVSRADLSPGVVLVSELVRIAADGSASSFDLLRGDEAYKYRLGASDRPVWRLAIVRDR